MKRMRLTLGMALLSASAAIAQKPTIEFSGRGILALSDGDMAASAVVDGKLMKEVGVKDALSVYPLPLKLGQEIGSTALSNSAIGWSRTAAVMSDGRYAFVIETRAQTTDSVKTVKNVATDFPAGSNLYIVDISNMAKPSTRRVSVGKNPLAVDMLGSNMLITSEETAKELRMFEIGAGGLPTRNVPIALNLQNARATDVTWHPEGEFIAITVEETKEIWLYKAKRNPQGKIATFEAFGTPAKLTGKPGPGSFTPDGSLFIVSDLKDGAAGELVAIQFNTTAADPKTAEHKVVAQTPVAAGVESFAISPDGTMIVTANKANSAQPWESSVGKAGVSLLSLAKDGKATKVADYEIEGIAPESIIFDKSGDNVAVSIFEYFDYGRRDGGVEFFKVNKGGTPSLTKQMAKISAPKGCHTVKLIP
ncbi:WD40 repeat domain-containing protein [Runella sp. SP2]|uniref:WD40 repeat domain-containing protein n=1 Tax=Runella sp. SP2 TaxID=2268026 RepID=UPI000F088C84|nr:WD40 repeat domain-containing protein [Runella sp. SP2]AYQ32344.1 WD40 repeat domain-containing protein [Runella sp. SP2]